MGYDLTMTNTIRVYDGKVYGKKVSDYGMEKGYLDYQTLGQIVGDAVRNNRLRGETMEDWEIVNGDLGSSDIYEDYIISDHGFKILKEITDELVFYNERLDIYVWAIDHYGTPWSEELTNTKLINMNDDISEIKPSQKRFWYMLLDRMRQDCNYYLSNGNRNPDNLYTGHERTQIQKMKDIWNAFPDEDKPEWLSMEEIEEYAERMGVK